MAIPNKEKIVKDLTVMLNSEVSNDAIQWLVREAYAWFWSQDFEIQGTRGKYEGCKYWSKAAKNLWLEFGNVPSGKIHITHEHVVPRAEFAQKLIEFRKSNLTITEKDVHDFFDKFCIACIVTKDEHKDLPSKMPGDWFEKVSVWGRYKVKEVKVVVGTISEMNPNNWSEKRYD